MNRPGRKGKVLGLDEIGGRMQAVADAAGLSSEEIAERLGYTSGGVRKWLRGENQVPMTILAAYARVVGCSDYWLWTGEQDPRDQVGTLGYAGYLADMLKQAGVPEEVAMDAAAIPSGNEPPAWLTQALVDRLRDFHARVRSREEPRQALQSAGLINLPLLARQAAALRDPREEFLNDLRDADPEVFATLTAEDMAAIAHMARALGRRAKAEEQGEAPIVDTSQDS